MVRFLARTALSVLANAVGLFLASVILDGFEINGAAFVVAVLIYTAAEVILGPFVTSTAIKTTPALRGATALVTTSVALILTSLISDGISISGFGTWVAAIVIVWLFALLASLVLPLMLFKKVLAPDEPNKE